MAETRVTSVLKDGYQVQNESRELKWVADEPEEINGTNLGPKPTELLLSSLASCKLITLKMYSERKNWDITGTVIELEIIEKATVTKVSKKITFPLHLSDEQKKRLLEISGRCPVVKMLSQSIEFEIIN
jgi:putative redox protein